MARKFKARKFAIRNQVFGTGSKQRVGLVPNRSIKVNGVKQKPGERARGGNQLVKKAQVSKKRK